MTRKVISDNAALAREISGMKPDGEPVVVLYDETEVVVMSKKRFDELSEAAGQLQDARDIRLAEAAMAEGDFMPYEAFRKELGLA